MPDPIKQSVLVLISDNWSQEHQYWKSISQSDITMKFKYLSEFMQENNPSKNKYDCIIIAEHGKFFDEGLQESGKKHRKKHKVGNKKYLKETAEVIELCLDYSAKILVASCHVGAVIKDLQSNPIKVEAEIVLLGGSKHPSINFDRSVPPIAKKFIEDGANGLYEFASTQFFDTMQIQNKDKTITKLGPVKINYELSTDSLPSLTRSTYVPNQSPKNPLKIKGIKEDSWWIQDQTKPIEKISQTDKDQLLCIAVNKNKTKDALFWLDQGASPNARFNFFDGPVIFQAVSLKNHEIVEALLKKGTDPNRLFEYKTLLRPAIENNDILMVKILLKAGVKPGYGDAYAAIYYRDISNLIEKAEAEKAEAEKAETEKAETEKAEAEKAETEKAATADKVSVEVASDRTNFAIKSSDTTIPNQKDMELTKPSNHSPTDKDKVEPVEPRIIEEDFNQKKSEIQEHFKRHLEELHLKIQTHNTQKNNNLCSTLLSAQEDFFSQLKPKLDEKQLNQHISEFRELCKKNVSAADKIMGHGWLYRIVEVLIKAVVGLFAGIGMVLGSLVGQGLVKPAHREKFKKTFLTLNQNEQSQALDKFKQETLGDTEENQGLISSQSFKK